MKYVNKDNKYTEQPTLPGIIWNMPLLHEKAPPYAFLFMLLLTVYAFNKEGLNLYTVIIAVFTLIIYYEAFIQRKIKSVYMTPQTVQAQLNKGVESIRRNLDDYFLLIDQHNRVSGSSNYRYKAALLHRENVNLSTVIDTQRVVVSPKKPSRFSIGRVGITTEDSLSAFIKIPSKKSNKINIPLVEDILCPVNLKDWVESFQKQIQKPLPVIYSSTGIRTDYETGIYKAKVKK